MTRRELPGRGSARRLPIAVIVIAAVAFGVAYLTDSRASASVVLEQANAASPRPGFLPPSTLAVVARTPVHTIGHVVNGDTAGLYGGAEANTCDAGAIRAFLEANPAIGQAWAQALLIRPSEIALYLASLTALTLRTDTAVTNHGYENGVATPFQSVLQAGTAVLVDAEGLPRVRCHCGNPLQVPAAPPEAEVVTYEGPRWAGFEPESVTVINPAPAEVTEFVVLDEQTDTVVERPRSTDGRADRPADTVVENVVRANFFVNGSGEPRRDAPVQTTSPEPTEQTRSVDAGLSVRSGSIVETVDATTSPADTSTPTGTTTSTTTDPGEAGFREYRVESSVAESENPVTTTPEPDDTTTTRTTTTTTTKPTTTTTKPTTTTKKTTTTTTKPTTTKPTTTTTTRRTTTTTTTDEAPPTESETDPDEEE